MDKFTFLEGDKSEEVLQSEMKPGLPFMTSQRDWFQRVPKSVLLAHIFSQAKQADEVKYEESHYIHFLRPSTDFCKTLLLYFPIWRWGMRRKGMLVAQRR